MPHMFEIFLTHKFVHETFVARKFPDLRYIISHITAITSKQLEQLLTMGIFY